MNFFRIFASVGILFYVFTRPDVNLRSMWDSVKNLPTLFWIYVVILTLCLYLLAVLRWLLLLRSFGIFVKFSLTLQLMFIGLFFNNMMPSLTGGDVIKAYFTARGTPKKMEAVASILLDRIFGVFAMVILTASASFFALNDPKLGPLAKLFLILVAFFLMGLTLFLNLSHLKKISKARTLIEKSHSMEKLKKFYNILTALKRKWKFALGALSLSLLIQCLVVFNNYILALGLGIRDISLGRFYIIIPITGFIAALPISFAGWGVGEGAYRAMFNMVNPLYGGIAVVLSVICRFIALVFSLVGLPFYLMYRHGPLEKGSQSTVNSRQI